MWSSSPSSSPGGSGHCSSATGGGYTGADVAARPEFIPPSHTGLVPGQGSPGSASGSVNSMHMGKLPPVTEIFGHGDYGYNTFRIPAIVFNERTNEFLAFCEARKESFHDWGNMDMALRKGKLDKENGDIHWGDIEIIVTMPGFRTMNPVPIIDKRNHSIVLVYNTFPENLSEAELMKCGRYQQTLYVTKSLDDGRTWSTPKDISKNTLAKMDPVPAIYSPGPGHGIQLRSGRLVVPGNSYWKPPPEPGLLSQMKHTIIEFFDTFYGAINCSNILYSDDGGETWFVGGVIPPAMDENGQPTMANECQAVELDEGLIYVNSRTSGTALPRQQAFSDDAGMSFSPGQLHHGLSEPGHLLVKWMPSVRNFGGCQASVIGFVPSANISKEVSDINTWVLFSNPASHETRCNMALRISRDGCRQWSRPWQLYPGPSAYSDLAMYEMTDLDGRTHLKVACMYECGSMHPYERIVFQTFTLQEFMDGLEDEQYNHCIPSLGN